MCMGSSELTSPVQAGVGGGHLLHPAPQLLAAAGSQGRDVPGPRQSDDRGLPHLGAARMDQRSLRQLLPGQDLGQGGARAGGGGPGPRDGRGGGGGLLPQSQPSQVCQSRYFEHF